MTPIYKIFIQKKFAPTYMCVVYLSYLTPKIKNKKAPKTAEKAQITLNLPNKPHKA